MSSQQARRQPASPASVEIPLRSFTGLWVFLALLGLGFVALAARGLAAPKARTAAERRAGQVQGPTKQQVRDRQEHIALTQRALELASKERKAAAAAAPLGSAPVGPAPVSAAQGGPEAASSPAAAAGTPRSGGTKAPAAQGSAAAGNGAPAAAPKTSKPAASSGLDEMRADIAATLE